MGYVKHDAVIVTLWEECDDELADLKAALRTIDTGAFTNVERLLVGPIEVIANFGRTYVLCPDGSKEGWDTSNAGDLARKTVIEHFRRVANYADIVEVTYGGDWEGDPRVGDLSNVTKDD